MHALVIIGAITIWLIVWIFEDIGESQAAAIRDKAAKDKEEQNKKAEVEKARFEFFKKEHKHK